MAQDLSHISKQVQKDTADIAAVRQQAETQRKMADQRHQEGNDAGATYYEQEAQRLDQQAGDMEKEIEALNTERERIEQRVSELETQRETAVREHTDTLAKIDDELAQLRGSDFMF